MTPASVEPAFAGRLEFIDALRVFACASVVICHVYFAGIFHTTVSHVIPRPLEWALGKTNLGISIFFVISGFVIAYSLRRAKVTGPFIVNFALRRSLRLDPTYWVAILLAIVVSAERTRRVTGSALPTPTVLFRNLFYLQGLTQTQMLVTVSWTLCYEVQFYLVLIVCLAVAHLLAAQARIRETAIAMLLSWPASLMSLAYVCGWAHPPAGLFVDLWYAFYLGWLTWWALDKLVHPAWLWTYAAAVTATLIVHWQWDTVVTLATTIGIYQVGRAGRLGTLCDWPIVRRLAPLTYSVYLIHGFIAVFVLDLGMRWSGDKIATDLLWMAVAVIITVAGAVPLCTFVERPTVRLSQRLKGRALGSVRIW